MRSYQVRRDATRAQVQALAARCEEQQQQLEAKPSRKQIVTQEAKLRTYEQNNFAIAECACCHAA